MASEVGDYDQDSLSAVGAPEAIGSNQSMPESSPSESGEKPILTRFRESPVAKGVSGLVGLAAIGSMVYIGVNRSVGEGGPSEEAVIANINNPTEESDGLLGEMNGEEFDQRDTEWLERVVLPEELTAASIEAEKFIYQMIRTREVIGSMAETSEVQAPQWRGAVVTKITAGFGDSNLDIWLRMDCPFETVVDGSIYFTGYSQTKRQLVTLKYGEIDGGDRSWTDEYLEMEARPYVDDPFSGQLVEGVPLSYDRDGLYVLDAYEQSIRGGDKTCYASADFFSTKAEATMGLGGPLYFGKDDDKIFRDQNILKQYQEQDEMLQSERN